ncbi:MAG: FG-GAP-like repeat-containing protein, partial [Candidatus Thermoplasmatota archaeon]|nr:FG-GAP-like repeat-containing protein [Candidatus Thermoplasmatota archaeon]
MNDKVAFLMVAIMVSAGSFVLFNYGAEGEKTEILYNNAGTSVQGGPIDLTEGGGMDTSYYFRVGKDVPISSAYMNISTYNSDQGQAIQSPYLDIGVDGEQEWTYDNVGYGKFGEQSFFSDGNVKKSMNIPSGGGYNTANSILIPEDAEIISADIDIQGRFIPKKIEEYQIMDDPSLVNMQGYVMEHGDIDNDGDIDIVVSDVRNDRILWLENPNNTSMDWSVHTVYSNYYVTNVYGLDLGDIDGDGDLDIACSSYSRGYVMYIRNNNNGASWSMYRFKTGYRYAGPVKIADMDLDGNPDIVCAAYYTYYYYSDEFLYWFKA